MFLFLIFFSGASFGNATEFLRRSYKIDANFRSYEKGSISAQMEATVRNESQKPLRELYWILYPNRFRTELPHLDDLNYRRIYPNGFSRGEMVIEEATASSAALRFEPVSSKGLPDLTLARTALPKELLPGESVTISIRYRIAVPEKYGSFGVPKNPNHVRRTLSNYVVSLRRRFHPEDLPARASDRI